MIEAICPDCGENMDPTVFIEKQICSECGCDLSSNTKLYNRIKRKMDEAGATASSTKTPTPTPSTNDAVSKKTDNSRPATTSLYQKNASMSTTGRTVNTNTTTSRPLSAQETDKEKEITPISSPKRAEQKTTARSAGENTAVVNHEVNNKQTLDSDSTPPVDNTTTSVLPDDNAETMLEYEEKTGAVEDITDNLASGIGDNEDEKDTLDDTIQAIPKKKKPTIEIPRKREKEGFERSFMPGKKLSFAAKIKENIYDSLPFLRKPPKDTNENIEPYDEKKETKPHGKVKLHLECDCSYSSNTDGYYNDVFFDNKPGADLIPIGTITKVCATLIGLFLLEAFFIYYV